MLSLTQTPTNAQETSPNEASNESEGGTRVNVVKTPIRKGSRNIVIKPFAQIPTFNGKPAKIVAIVNQGKYLYVTTSSTGGYIYRIDEKGNVMLWFDVTAAVFAQTGRNISFVSGIHGGVRGLAFHPTFYRTGLFYISALETRPRPDWSFKYLSKPPPGVNRAIADSVILEWRYDFAKRRVDETSYRNLFRVGLPYLDHPIKQMIFIGYHLYIGHGDGSLQSGSGGGGQNNDALGKILRITPIQRGDLPYTIPQTNPYIGNPNYIDETYAIGFRNPHNLCYSARSGLFVTDVGRDNVEEINIVKGGRDYGWPRREGTFRHLKVGGTESGVKRLPFKDAQFKYTYPNVQVGHNARRGERYVGLALAGSCPIENGSKNDGLFLYANFPETGELYYSNIRRMQSAVTMGKPSELTQATTFLARILYDHDDDPKTADVKVKNLRDIVRLDLNRTSLSRADVRFGRGRRGEIYWSSKSNGKIYVITSSIPS